MKLLHIYPAIAVIADSPRITPGTVVLQGRTFYVWRGYNVYLDTETRQTRYKEAEGRSSYWTELRDGLLICVISSTRGDEEFTRLMLRGSGLGDEAVPPIAQLPELLAKQQVIADDPEGYSVRSTAAIAQRRAEREADSLRRTLERKAAEEKATNARVVKNTALFAAGEYIELAGFEELCKLHGIVIPIRTIGSARRNVSKVSTSSLSLHGKGTPMALLEAATKLKAVLTASPEVAA